jgi:regulator of protease activity HflC (stomatin/prohibitin superfamily)
MFITRFTVSSHDFAQLSRYGVVVGELSPGRTTKFGGGWSIITMDNRPSTLVVANQEIYTSDQLTVKTSIQLMIQLIDLTKALASSESFSSSIYYLAQIAVRTAVSTVTLEELVSNPKRMEPLIYSEVNEKIEPYGHKIISVSVVDVILPPQIRKAKSALTIAKLEGQANLEKTRAETAALRSLVNAANLVKEHPELAQLRMIQALQEANTTIQVAPKIG